MHRTEQSCPATQMGEKAPLTDIRARLHWVTVRYKSINDHMPSSHNSPLDPAQRERWTASTAVTYTLPAFLAQGRDNKQNLLLELTEFV